MAEEALKERITKAFGLIRGMVISWVLTVSFEIRRRSSVF